MQDVEAKYSPFVDTGNTSDGFANGTIDQMAQPNVAGLTPLGTYGGDRNDAPQYTQDVDIRIRHMTEDDEYRVDQLHEGTGDGLLVLHPPELMDYMLHGSGVNPDSRWPSTLSDPALLLHNSERADASSGDDTYTILAWGVPLKGTSKPGTGIYAELDPATRVLNFQHTNSGGSDEEVLESVKVDDEPVQVGPADTLAEDSDNGTSTMADTGLSVSGLKGGGIYAFEAVLFCGSEESGEPGVDGGLRFDLDASTTSGIGAIRYQADGSTDSGPSHVGQNVESTSTDVEVFSTAGGSQNEQVTIHGTVEVSAGDTGALGFRHALPAAASDGGTATIKANSWMRLTRVG